MKYIPRLKLVTNILRTLIFLFILYLSEDSIGSINLMSFTSISTVIGIIISFGLVDSLVVCSEKAFNRYKKFSKYFYIFLFFNSFLIFLDIKLINNILCGIYFGAIFWSYGEIRRYSPLLYELILSVLMLLLWVIYLSFLSAEKSSFQILTIIFGMFSFLLFFVASFFRINNAAKINSYNFSGFLSTSLSKQGWEFSYSFLTRSSFIIWGTSSLLHPITSYVYFYCELVSAIFSHYQTLFVTSNSLEKNKYKFFEFIKFLSISYSILFFSLINIFIFQDKLVSILTVINLPENFLYLFSFDKTTLIFIIVMAINIFILQVFSYGRYALILHDKFSIILVLFLVSVIYYAISIFYININQDLITYSNIILTLLLAGSFLLSFRYLKNLKN